MRAKDLTEKRFWDNYWEIRNSEAAEIKRSGKDSGVNAILDVFGKYLPINEDLHALEIGGAPGQYLIYMAKNFGYHLHSLDFSKVGNEQTLKYLTAANIKIDIYERDLFSERLKEDLPLFDIVYSLGFIEHFEDFNQVVRKHIDLLRPGGILLIGVPNLGGVYGFFLKRTAPQLLAIHNQSAMKSHNWDKFEKELNLTTIFKGYVGGFEPLAMKKLEKKDLLARSMNFIVKRLVSISTFRSNLFRKFNSRYWSMYLIGIYIKN
jgi:2-polyprenyl-3-methyl-5-hydroxy-6-metoxy-1,4-benzoquinol methylase